MMHARNALRLVLIVLAGLLALPLVVSVLALRGPAPGARAAGGDPSVIATIRTGWGGRVPLGVAVNASTDRVYVTNGCDDTVSVIGDVAPPTPVPTARGVGGKVMLPPAAIAAQADDARTRSGDSATTWMALASAVAGAFVAGGRYAHRRYHNPHSK